MPDESQQKKGAPKHRELIEKLENTRGNMFRTFAQVDDLFSECIAALQMPRPEEAIFRRGFEALAKMLADYYGPGSPAEIKAIVERFFAHPDIQAAQEARLDKGCDCEVTPPSPYDIDQHPHTVHTCAKRT